MIHNGSVDRYTNTPEDAASFERHRGGSYGYDEDRPSPGELAEMAADDRAAARRQAERDAAARARGEYVPSSAMRLAATTLSMTLAQRGVFGMDVEPAREGILRVTPEHPARAPQPEVVLDTLRAIYGDDAEVREALPVIWVRIIRTAFADPFVVDGVANDEPPF